MLLGFQARFAPLVESGEKTQTIRALRKDGRVPRIGERLYLYTGLRTKYVQKLGEGEVTEVHHLHLARADCTGERSHLDGQHLFRHEVEAIARADGFRDADGSPYRELLSWFEDVHGLPFAGTLIRWRLLPPPSPPAGKRRA